VWTDKLLVAGILSRCTWLGHKVSHLHKKMHHDRYDFSDAERMPLVLVSGRIH